MTNQRKLTLELLSWYFKYLRKWNNTSSLSSISESIDSILENGRSVTDSDMEMLGHAADFEYNDTKNMTTQKVMSLDDVYQLIMRESRNSKIEDILSK
jgi:hypothetical protein